MNNTVKTIWHNDPFIFTIPIMITIPLLGIIAILAKPSLPVLIAIGSFVFIAAELGLIATYKRYPTK